MMTTLTRVERSRWEAKRQRHDGAIIEAARQSGRLPIIDCTAPGYPVPPAILRALDAASDPDARERAYRGAVLLRRQAASWRSLAVILERDAKLEQAESLRTKATAAEQQADALEESVAPL